MFKHDVRPKAAMTDEMVKTAVARFLKNISATAQGEIEKSVRNAIASGKLKGHETFTMAVSLSSEKVGINVTLYNTIEL
jgi:hypothetical protein